VPEAARGWPAPAKINLFLHVVGRRADGYHLLQTAFQFLDLADCLHISVRQDPAILRRGPLPGVPADEDLCVRAARLLQERTGTRLGAELALDKHIPVGGGLGGGSSDAATTLVALNRLWGTGLGEDELAALGLELGADVPVFVRGRAAWAEGVGERLEPVTLPEPWYVLLVPPVSVSTAAVFADPQLTRDSPPITISDFLSGRGGNDCLPVVLRRYPEVAAAWRWLQARAPARLTGTGGCLYAPVASAAAARRLAAEVPAPWRGLAARGLNRSPLGERLAG